MYYHGNSSVEQVNAAWVPSPEIQRESPVLRLTRGRRPRAHPCRAPGRLRTPQRTVAGPGPRHTSQDPRRLGEPGGVRGHPPHGGRWPRDSRRARPGSRASAGRAHERPAPRAAGGGAAQCLPVARTPGPGAPPLGRAPQSSRARESAPDLLGAFASRNVDEGCKCPEALPRAGGA